MLEHWFYKGGAYEKRVQKTIGGPQKIGYWYLIKQKGSEICILLYPVSSGKEIEEVVPLILGIFLNFMIVMCLGS